MMLKIDIANCWRSKLLECGNQQHVLGPGCPVLRHKINCIIINAHL